MTTQDVATGLIILLIICRYLMHGSRKVNSASFEIKWSLINLVRYVYAYAAGHKEARQVQAPGKACITQHLLMTRLVNLQRRCRYNNIYEL